MTEKNLPANAPGSEPAVAPTTGSKVADFVRRMKLAPTSTSGRGRLLFAMDATMSRQPTWDMAQTLQGEMFRAVETIGGLDVQLVFFRGAYECRASKWVADANALAALMRKVACAGGHTQIGRVLSHAVEQRPSAVVYVGDCMEENFDELCQRANKLALLGVPVFLFQEGNDARAESAFREIARLSKGAYCRFDAGAADQLKNLLSAVAVYAAGGREALRSMSGEGARLLLQHIK